MVVITDEQYFRGYQRHLRRYYFSVKRGMVPRFISRQPTGHRMKHYDICLKLASAFRDLTSGAATGCPRMESVVNDCRQARLHGHSACFPYLRSLIDLLAGVSCRLAGLWGHRLLISIPGVERTTSSLPRSYSDKCWPSSRWLDVDSGIIRQYFSH